MDSEAIVRLVVKKLNEFGRPYMMVGSFSTNFYGIPRSTQDADFVVQLGPADLDELRKRLGPDFTLDPQIGFETVTGTTKYLFRHRASHFKIEFFELSEDAHDQARFSRRRQVDVEGLEVFMPAPEDVVITKARWVARSHRLKDRQDLQDVIAVQRTALDWDYIQHWAKQHGTHELVEEIRRSIPPV